MECGSLRPSTLLIAAALLIATPFTRDVLAQESKSSSLATELVTLLKEKKLDSIAARSPTAADQFVAALYFPANSS